MRLWDAVVAAGLVYLIGQFNRTTAIVYTVLFVIVWRWEFARETRRIEQDEARWKEWILRNATDEEVIHDPKLRAMYGDYSSPFHPVRMLRDLIKKKN